jgi:hypothetical protein
MYMHYIAEFAYGNSAGPFNIFPLDISWIGGQGAVFRCNECVWLVPGTEGNR